MDSPQWQPAHPVTSGATMSETSPTNQMSDPEVPDLRAVAMRLSATAQQARFRSLLALLERLLPSEARIGGTGPAAQERVRLRHDPALIFSAGDVTQLALKERAADESDFSASPPLSYFEVTTSFLGLTGAVTPLPTYIAEEIAQEDPENAHRREFLDLFHHRLLALLYRWVTKYDVGAEFSSDAEDAWSQRLLALAGFDTYDGQKPAGLPTWRLLRLSAIFANRARTAQGLATLLEDVLAEELEGTPVRIREFVGHWAPIAQMQRTTLGRTNSQLGKNAILGSRIYDRSSAFEIALGPLPYKTYERFLPGGDLPGKVSAAIACFLREPLEHVLKISLRPEGIPRLSLSKTRRAGLGRDTWLGTRLGQTTVVTVRQ